MNRTIFVLFMLAGGLFLNACDGLILVQPKPTPTLTEHEEYEEELAKFFEEAEEINREVSHQAYALAKRLSGDNAIDCGQVDDWDWYEHAEDIWEVNDCTIEAFQKKQAFRILNNKPVEDASLLTWIVATPENIIYLVEYFQWVEGGSGPSAEQECWEPQISTYDDVKYLVCKKNP